jgi:uncharacterized protein
VPFTAITSFVDPSVQFGLKFDVTPTEGAAEEPAAPEPTAPKALPGRRGLAAVTTGKKEKTGSDSVVTLKPHDIKPATPPLAPVKPTPVGKAEKPAAPPAPKKSPTGEDGKVLSIDAFRKKP